MRHRVKTLSFRSPLNVFTDMFECSPSFSWRSYMVAGTDELNKELEEADKERDQLQEHAHSLRQELELVKLQLSETVEEMKEKA